MSGVFGRILAWSWFCRCEKGLPGKFEHVLYCHIKSAFLLAVYVSESGQSLLILVCRPSQWHLSGGIVFRESCSLVPSRRHRADSNVIIIIMVKIIIMVVMVLLTSLNCCMSTLRLVHYALFLTPACWKSNNTKRKTHGFRTFSCFGPRIRSSLPQDFRRCSTLSSFKAKLKTFLFSQYFHPD